MEVCKHCNDPIIGKPIQEDNDLFCCNGCSSVYQILNNEDFQSIVCELDIDSQKSNAVYFDELNNPDLERKFIKFQDKNQTLIEFHIPGIHCSSCVWLFEKLPEIDPRIIQCSVSFESRTVLIKYYHQDYPSADLAQFLRKMGYPPDLKNQGQKKYKTNRKNIIKLGLAGFCFGNIMLFSFPDYLSMSDIPPEFQKYFGIISAVLSIPLLFYSGWDYFEKAALSFRMKKIDINIPIALGMATIFLFSSYLVFYKNESAYFDSLSGLIFFLLLGQFFQNKLFESFKRERDIEDFFPLAVLSKTDDQWIAKGIKDLKIGDIIKIRNNEVIPCDALLINGQAKIDNSFITGESILHSPEKEELIYAGGRQEGSAIELRIQNTFDQATWTKIWEENGKQSQHKTIIDKLAGAFTISIIFIAIGAGILWSLDSWEKGVRVFSTVLIIACPCALALSQPITFGHLLRKLGKKGIYLKSASTIPLFTHIKHIVFDKTGTLTINRKTVNPEVFQQLNNDEVNAFFSLANESAHPYSVLISKSLSALGAQSIELENLEEIKGKGLIATYDKQNILIGSKNWMKENEIPCENAEGLFLAFDNKIKCLIPIDQEVRPGVNTLIGNLQKTFDIHVISGDTEQNMEQFRSSFPSLNNTFHKQKPEDKVQYIENLEGNTLMIGDGLNDAGALLKADIGLAINDSEHAYFPKSNGLIIGSSLKELSNTLKLANWSQKVVIICVIFSLAYNLVGLYFATTLQLNSLIAAILMPLSSITILLLSSILMKLKD